MAEAASKQKVYFDDELEQSKVCLQKFNGHSAAYNMKRKNEKIGRVARSMIDGSLNYFQGAELLVNLREDAGIYENDPDFVVFIGVLTEIDYLRADGPGFNWSLLEEPELENRLKNSLNWAKEISLVNCASIAKRYSR